MTRNGGIWSGESVFQGGQVSIALESSAGSTVEKKHALGDDVGQRNSANDSANIGIK